MPETKPKKRDSMIDQIGQQAAQEPSKSAQNKTISSKQSATLIEKKNNIGRPTHYSKELALHICELLADGHPLRRITQMDGMPRSSTVYEWLQIHEDFADMYTRAREDAADAMADEIVAIADEQPELVPIYDKEGQLVEIKIDTAFMAWQKNRMDARKWTASKLKPRKYGDRQILAGDADNPVEVKQQSEVIEAFMMNLQLLKQTGGKK